MPFLVDSLTMELSRQLRDVHLVIHPLFDVVRDITGALQSVDPVADGALEPRRARPCASRGCTSRSTGSPTATTPRRSSRTSSGCCATSARPSRTGTRCTPRSRTSCASCRPTRRRSTPTRCARPASCCEWLADDHFTFLGYREYQLERRRRRRVPPRRPRHRPRHPARRPGHVRVVRPAAARPSGQGPREDPAGADQGQLARDRAPPGVPRLRRRQDVRERRGRRRAPLPRPVLQRGLHRVADPDPAAAREGRRGAQAQRLRPAQPRRQGADGHPRDLPARRAVPHAGRRAGADGRGGDARAASAARCGCSSAATPTAATSRCSSTCRATATTPPSASGSRRSSRSAWAASRSSSPCRSTSRRPPACTSSCTRPRATTIPDVDTADLERRLTEASRSWRDDFMPP